jgi:hypothetical protein
MALTHKEWAKKAAEQNEMLRATWQAEYGDIPASHWMSQVLMTKQISTLMDGHHFGVHVSARQHSFKDNDTLFSLHLHVKELLHLIYLKVQSIRNISCNSSTKILCIFCH